MRETVGRGRFQATREGFGFIRPEEPGQEIFVPPGETGGALQGDSVAYRLVHPGRRGRKPEGQVTAILERGIRKLTGVVAGTRRRPVLVPDHPRLPAAMRLTGSLSGLEPGQRVLCRLHDAGGRSGPGAMFEEILGDADDPRLDVSMIAVQFGLPEAYPDEAVAEARASRARLEGEPLADRRDFSGELTFTIDPVDAADFDDAVSLKRTAGEGWRLRVHIADVGAAVTRGGALDREARRRGTSAYFPGSVIPMLPEVLSNEGMSLAPGRPRRVISVSALLGPDGALRGVRLDEGVIVSAARLTYEQVQDVLDKQLSLDPRLDAALAEADRLAQILRGRRLARGAFDLCVPEAEVQLGERGEPLAIRRRLSGRSHQIIEEFMILANRITCRYARTRGHPFLFRVHDMPEAIALEQFREMIPFLAPDVRVSEIAELPALRRWLGGLPPGLRTWRIHALFLRSLRRASYADRDRGHFGLGLRGYGHFTSPIRRYPDLFNHRVIRWALHHDRRPVPEDWRVEAAELAPSCSAAEERAEEAERELLRVKALRWAAERIGASFRGSVVAVGSRGATIELDAAPVEGIVSRGEELALPGHRQGRRQRPDPLQLGDPVIVQVARVSLRERVLTFALRAAGRRALETDPDALDAWDDPHARTPEPSGRARRRPSRRKRLERRGRARAGRPAERRGRRRTGR